MQKPRNDFNNKKQIETDTGLAGNSCVWYHVFMALSAKEKIKVIEKFRVHESDTGSTEVQIAVLTEEINRLTGHLKAFPKDNHSRRGLLGMVGRRKKFLDYLKNNQIRKYNSLIKKLGLKR